MVIRPGVSAIILTGEGLLLQRRSDNRLWGLPEPEEEDEDADAPEDPDEAEDHDEAEDADEPEDADETEDPDAGGVWLATGTKRSHSGSCHCMMSCSTGMIDTTKMMTELFACASLNVRAKSAAVISSAAAKSASGTHASSMPINSGAPRWNLMPKS